MSNRNFQGLYKLNQLHKLWFFTDKNTVPIGCYQITKNENEIEMFHSVIQNI